MELKSALAELKASSEFKEWFKNNDKTYFSYAFAMIEDNAQSDWQIGYYDKNKDKITTFIIKEKEIIINPEEDIFKKGDMEVKKIDADKIKLELKNILSEAEKFQKGKYPKEIVIKKIIILQNLENLENVWNITFFTQSFNTLNIKIRADDGKIVEDTLTPLFELDASSQK